MGTIREAKRIVVKVGTSTLTHSTGQINIRRMETLVKVLSDIQGSGRELVLVTSGAIGIGIGKLGLRERPEDIPGKQAAAAVGQCELMYLYDRTFAQYNHTVAQVLLTKYTFADGEGQQNARNTFERLLKWGVIPIVNENDTVATHEIKVGDNDTLSAMVAAMISAHCLVILTDIDGLYTADPQADSMAALIPEVREITPELLAAAGGAGSTRGTGGMFTKLQAAQIATAAGMDVYIINGKSPERLYDLLEGKAIGTHFVAHPGEKGG